jgi:hypothetical protein
MVGKREESPLTGLRPGMKLFSIITPRAMCWGRLNAVGVNSNLVAKSQHASSKRGSRPQPDADIVSTVSVCFTISFFFRKAAD